MNNSFMNKLAHVFKNILLIPVKLVQFFCLGLFFTATTLIGLFVNVFGHIFKYAFVGLLVVSKCVYHSLKYAFKGLIVVSKFIYHVLKYMIKGISVPFIFIHNGIVKWEIYEDKKKQERLAKEAKIKEARRLEKERIEAARRQKIADARKKKEKDIYINEKEKLTKKTTGERINDFLVAALAFPKRLIEDIKKKLNNTTFARNKRNQKEIERNELLIDFEGADAEKSETKQLYEYEAKTAEGKYIKGYFEAFSKVEVHSFLLSEGYTVYSIKTNKWIQRLHALERTSQKKMKNKDLIFFLTQLSTYIKSGIPLVDSLRILERQYKDKGYKRIFKTMIYDLTMGENFSTAMDKQGKAFPPLLINMVKTSELTGSLPEVLDDMADYYTETEKTRKEMITAMTYPSIVMFVALAVTTFIMVYVIPKFVEIYESIDASQIPGITIAIMNLSSFIQKYFWIILLVIIAIVALIVYCYRNVKLLKTLMQWTMMHLPVFGNIIIYNEVTMFTKTFSSLLEHNVFITDSMDILNKITNNEIYRMLILDTITNLAKGEKISKAFKGHWAFPVPAYEMLVTGEKTGELPQMMRKVSNYYQDMHRNAVTRVKTFMEPVLIIFLTFIVGIIVLSIVIPMFNVYSTMEKI